ncbi:T9SS type A sorting domain-containing protein [Maribacter ulvicola]|uniref:Por secretion system C-terminal sorting domain-containing protein n=1 Tax=Maribacter ulvicola TaxID=228959 RepID=A0A1N6R293_9FLAO|nr:T9SS type A sorting domain-containing protein [Maribacter ulvicola]SIQ22897.1 Por secretion system C-terminal sorting domain-containing protein [Maribacter ulvicola]
MKNILTIFIFITLSTGKIEAQEIKIFPNPATNVINVLGLKNDLNAVIRITDSYGTQFIYHKWDIRRNALNIPVIKLEKGLYMITIQSELQNVKAKFYKK